MSLYGDLESNGSKTTKEQRLAGWGSNMKMLESQKKLQQSRQQLSFNKLKKVNMAPMAPVVDLKRRNDDTTPFSFNSATGRMEQLSTDLLSQDEIDNAAQAMPNNIAVGEYDPLRPNEYDSSLRNRKRSNDSDGRKLADGEAEEEDEIDITIRAAGEVLDNGEHTSRRDAFRRGRGGDNDPRADGRGDGYGRGDSAFSSREHRGGDGRGDRPDRGGDRDRSDRKSDRDEYRGGGGGRDRHDERLVRYDDDSKSDITDEEEDDDRAGAAIAPPSFLQISDPPSNKPTPKGNIASKIMARMGYKQGLGLGKGDQGMANPLTVERTSKTSCKILHEDEIGDQMMPPPMFTPPGAGNLSPFTVPANTVDHNYPPITSNASLMANPTRVILLRNMVSPGEVDEDLEDETASECTKYGKVIKCTICENYQADNEEGVRIFLQFEKVDSAIRAVIDLNGRFFGGRSVKATFYNVDDFKDMKLNNEA